MRSGYLKTKWSVYVVRCGGTSQELSKASVGMSADAARKSARATLNRYNLKFIMSDARLEFNDEQGRRVIHVDKDLFTIGRRAENDLQLTGKEVSREHAEIFTQNGKFVLRDKESRYGTFVNGERITGDRVLGLLDRIR